MKEMPPNYMQSRFSIRMARTDIDAAKAPAKCPSCGTAVLEGDAFCRKCGAKAPVPRICRSCRSTVPEGDGFCRSCGTPFEG